MKIEITEINGSKIAQAVCDGIEIKTAQDALDLMANCGVLGARKIIIGAESIIPGFFDLKTGIAGEILQKFSNYRVQLAITGDFSKYPGKTLPDFIYESNKTGQIFFVDSPKTAKEKLSK